MPILTRRYNDPAPRESGFRVLVCRFRPRGVRREDESWDVFWPNLGPSVDLHAAYYGKRGPPISWETYRVEYLRQMESQTWWIRALADRVRAGETISLLCSSACVDESRCHRSLLGGLIEERLAPATPAAASGKVIRRPRKA